MKKFLIIFAISFISFALIIGGVTLYYLSRFQQDDKVFSQIVEDNPELEPPSVEDDPVANFLIMGIDDARSDFMMVVRFNKENNKAAIISIPRDTRVYIKNYGYNKINSAVARKEGILLAMETVGNLLDIPIHYYIEMDFEGAERIIDIMGGVKINVPIDMKYDDPVQDLHINIKAGEQVLNGKKAVHFVRYRATYSNGDLGRINAQQQFVKALIEHMTSSKILPKAFSILDTASKYVKTNMDKSEIASYALKLREVDINGIKMYTLPGDAKYIDSISYYIYDENKLQQMTADINNDIGVQNDEEDTVKAKDDKIKETISTN